MPYTLRNDKIKLRAVERDDLDMLYFLENEIAETGSSVSNQPVSRMMLWNYIQSYSADIAADRQLRLIVEDAAGNAVGTVDISDYDAANRRGYVGVAILASYRGKGYGTAALDMLCRYASHTLGLHQLAAQVAVDNEPSRRLFASVGFKACGRLRSWVRRGNSFADILIFQRLF